MSTEETICEEIQALKRRVETMEAAIRVLEAAENERQEAIQKASQERQEQIEKNRLKRLQNVDVKQSTVLKGRKLSDFSTSWFYDSTVFHFSFDDGSKEEKQSLGCTSTLMGGPNTHTYNFLDGSQFVLRNQ